MNHKLVFFRRSCPSKYLFKYQHENDGNRDVIVKCLVCQCTLLDPDDSQMKRHYLKCGQKQPSSNIPHIVAISFENDLMNARNRLHGIEYVHENSVSAIEKRLVRKFNNPPGYKELYMKSLKGLERFYECQTCLKKIKSENLRDRHR